MRNGFRIYDTHTHVGHARHSGRTCSADQLLAAMDRCGVDRAVVFPFPIVDDHRAAHDEVGRAVRQHPDRFTGAACMYPYVSEREFRDEVRRSVEEFGFRGLKFQPQYQPLNPLSPRSDFLFETAVENDLTLICHTGTGVPFALPSLYIMPARKFPDLRIVLGHAGGGVYVAEAIVAAAVCPNIYIDLSSLMPHHILEVLQYVPASRLMAGSDLLESMETEISKLLSLEASEATRRQILWETAERLFH
jgi:predicted TIM-barrel fold metal-dependent hydrolase